MDSRDASRTLEVIRTLMERTTQYQFLTARAGLAAGVLACIGSVLFVFLDMADPWHFQQLPCSTGSISLAKETGLSAAARIAAEANDRATIRMVITRLHPTTVCPISHTLWVQIDGDCLCSVIDSKQKAM